MHSDGSLVYVESYVSSTVKEQQESVASKILNENEKKNIFPLPSGNMKKQSKI